jgi:hypothetical protein
MENYKPALMLYHFSSFAVLSIRANSYAPLLIQEENKIMRNLLNLNCAITIVPIPEN